MLAFWIRYFVVASWLLLVVPPICWAGVPEEKSAGQLKRDVDERERQLTQAQRELAEARARLALAKGERALAITELRKAVAFCQGEVQWIRDHPNWFCDPREPMDQAQWNLAHLRVWLAEVEGDTPALVAAREKIVGFHEQRLERVRRLEQMRAATPEDVSAEQNALDEARRRLEAGKKQLSTDRAKNPDASK